MENYNIVKAKDGKVMCRRLHQGDRVEILASSVTLKNPQKKYVGKYLTIEKDEPKMIVTEHEDEGVAIIEEHIIEMHTFKELWELFKKLLLKIPKINNIVFRIIKNI